MNESQKKQKEEAMKDALHHYENASVHGMRPAQSEMANEERMERKERKMQKD